MCGSTEIAREFNFNSNSNHATSKGRLPANQGQQNNSKVAATGNYPGTLLCNSKHEIKNQSFISKL